MTDLSDPSVILHLTGPQARDVLAGGCPLDLDPRVFEPGRCAQSRFVKTGILLH